MQTLQGVAPGLPPNPALMQTFQGVPPIPPPNPALMQTLQSAVLMPPGHAHSQTAKGIAPPPPKRDSAPPPPPPLGAVFAKPPVVLAPPSVDALTAPPEESSPARIEPLPQLVIDRPSAPSASTTTEVVAEAETAKRASVHDMPTDPGGPESAVLPPESEWGASAPLAPPDVSEPEAFAEQLGTPPTERRPSHESLLAAARDEGEVAAPKDAPRALSVFDSETIAEDEDEGGLPPAALAAKLDASDVEFTRPLPPELAQGIGLAPSVDMEPYGSDDDLTRPLVNAADLARLSAAEGSPSALPRPMPPPPRPQVPVVVAFPPPRATAMDHAPSVQIADTSSTEVTIPRSPLVAHGPSGLPRIPPPSPVPAEFGERSSRRSRAFAESIAPATGSIFPASVSRSLGSRTMLAAAAAVIGVGALVLIFRPSSGSMLLTVGGPGGAAVQGISVKVDGKERCTSTPCEIPELKAGSHVITATAAGISGETEEAIRVERGEQTAHHVALKGEKLRAPEPPPEDKPAPVAEAPKEEPRAEETKPAPIAEAPREEPAAAAEAPRPQKQSVAKSEPVARASHNVRSSAPAPKPAPAIASTKPATETKGPAPVAIAGSGATLDLSSTPRAAVVVNGRPMGMTPLKGVKVAPGKQTIVFVHPDLGRKVASANLAPGARTTVGVKF